MLAGVLATGTDEAATPMFGTISLIFKLWNMHPQDAAVCRAACRLLRHYVCNDQTTATGAALCVDATVCSIPSLVNGVRVHGAAQLETLRVQLDLLVEIGPRVLSTRRCYAPLGLRQHCGSTPCQLQGAA